MPNPPPSRRSPPASDPLSRIDLLLYRPDVNRAREFRYRFGQAAVFGLPVLVLDRWGLSLGGPEAGRWVAILQALLTGWVVYVAGAGMIVEGLLVLVGGRGTTGRATGRAADMAVALVAVTLYAYALIVAGVRLLGGTVSTNNDARPTAPFHWVVIVLAVWAALRWAAIARRAGAHRDASDLEQS